MDNRREEAEDAFFRGIAGNRSGVALIIVLGLTVLMMVLCVTFAIYMRTERVAAANYAKDVVVRQLAYAAVNRAMAAIDTDLGTGPYPQWDVLVSGGVEPVNGVTNAPAAEWIPQAIWPGAGNPLVVRVSGGTTTVATAFTPQWFVATTLGNNVEYRIGYAAFNCSGLLDANYAGGASNRAVGTNVSEIQIADLPEVGSAANRDLLCQGRPYETVQEMGASSNSAIGLLTRPWNLVAYSAFPRGSWDVGSQTVRTNLVDISGDATALSNRRPAIVSALVSSLGVPQSDADAVFESLLDYVDSDDDPRNLASPDTELVPMINEVQVGVDVNFDEASGTCLPLVSLKVEWFYPFSKTTPNNFELEYSIIFMNLGDFAAPANVTGTCGIDFTPNVDRNRIHYWENAPTVWEAPAFNYTTNVGKSVAYSAVVQLRIKDTGTGRTVDEVPSPWTVGAFDIRPPAIVIPASPPASGTMSSTNGAECTDPRFNWDVEGLEMQQWYNYSDVAALSGDPAAINGSLEAQNYMTTWYWSAASGAESDRHAYMHVADAPLKTVSELTYLCRGRNDNSFWNTIHLHGESAAIPVDPVLDFFTVGNTPVAKGLANPNTRQKEVLDAVLLNTPLDNYPGEAGAIGLSGSLRDSVVDQWVSYTGNNPVRNLSELGNMTNVFALSGFSSLSPLQKEAWLRNTSGLLSPRQQYFMILAFVETSRYVPQIGTTRLGRLRALAEVWRDPYRASDGHHPTLIRMVRILNEK